MNLFPEQISAAGARQLEAQLQIFRSAAGSALDGAEQFAALQFAATRGALEKSTELLRQVAAAKDPRDLFALVGQGQFQLDSVLAYQRKLFGIATAMTGSVAGLPRAATPAASAALQKLAALPPVAEVTVVADHIIEQTEEVVEQLADEASAAPAAAPAPAPAATAPAPAQPVVDDIIEQTNEVVEELAELPADAEQPLEAPTSAPTSEPPAPASAEPIAELTPVAAAAGHQEPQPSAAPFTVASSDTPIEVEQVEPTQPMLAAAAVDVAKSSGRQRKK
jgi:phasin family protein